MNYIVIPVVIGPHMTRKCINSALAQDIGNVTVIVVGNGCRDGSMEYLRGVYWRNDAVQFVYHSLRSLNFIWNNTLRYVFEFEPHCMVINNDIVMRTDTYRLLLNDCASLVTGVGVDGDIGEATPSLRSPHPCFSCFMIRRSCWEAVGEFDETFWAYCSDLDYHLRMHKAGLEAVSLAVPFYHEGSATMKMVDNATRDWLQAKADKDREYFKRKWGFSANSPEYEAAFRTGALPTDTPKRSSSGAA